MLDSHPKISIVTPCYKAEHLIEGTIKSILDQGYPNLEYIVLDGAGDDTASILRKYENKIHYWRSRPDEGQYKAITEGFSIATGEIFFWLNADDMLLPKSLFVVAEVFAKNPSLQWLSTLKPGAWDADGHLASIDRIPGFSKEAFLDGVFLKSEGKKKAHWIQQESTFFTSALWKKAGGKIPDYSLAGDFSLWCEFYRHAELIGIDYPIAGFRHIEGQRSGDLKKYIEEASHALNLLREDFNFKPKNNRITKALRDLECAEKIPKIVKKLGYPAKKFYKPNISKPKSEWAMSDYRFIP